MQLIRTVFPAISCTSSQSDTSWIEYGGRCHAESDQRLCVVTVNGMIESRSSKNIMYTKILFSEQDVIQLDSHGKVQVHQNHFHPKIFSSKSTFIKELLSSKNHFHQKATLIKKPISLKNQFHQKPASSKTSFIKNHFHQRPLSSETTFIRNHFSPEQKQYRPCLCERRLCTNTAYAHLWGLSWFLMKGDFDESGFWWKWILMKVVCDESGFWWKFFDEIDLNHSLSHITSENGKGDVKFVSKQTLYGKVVQQQKIDLCHLKLWVDTVIVQIQWTSPTLDVKQFFPEHGASVSEMTATKDLDTLPSTSYTEEA